jgi:CheY-like chemotaxis protein
MAAERILLIEDETGARCALESLLTEDGYVVCSEATGAAGLRRADEFRPDTVICDYYLPDIDGLQVLRRMRAAEERSPTFIMVTAGCGGEEAERTVQREVDFFLRKPVNLSQFRRLLQHAGTGRSRVGAPDSRIKRKDSPDAGLRRPSIHRR